MHPFILLVLSGMVHAARGFPGGNVGQSCGDMVPSHPASAQNTAPPYTVTASQSTYTPGAQIKVTLQANSGLFKGFLLEAREVGGSSPVGTFSVTGNTAQLLSCNGVASTAVSQTSSSAKSSIAATWTAPQSGNFNIEFRATFVQSTNVFWVQVKSPTVTYTGTQPVITTTSSPSTTTKSMAPNLFVPSPSISSASCGLTKSCVSQPANCDPSTSTNCYFTSVQPSSTNSSTFVIELVGPSQGYVSMGFSDDQRMGNDDIYICVVGSNGVVQVQHAYSRGAFTPTVLPLGSVFNVTTSLQNGVISCSFTSQNSISTQRSLGMNTFYYLLFATGPSSSGNILEHTKTFTSSQMVNVSSPGSLGSGSGEPSFVKAHGCLMLIAWMTTGTLGMMIARYMKGATKDQSYFNKDLWFLLHFGLMSLSVAATCISFIVIFSCVQDWSGGAHPVLGCLVMILSFIQPIAAAFRCAPQHKLRYIFYWGHALNALAIKILAIAAIFTGLALIDTTENQWLQKVMGGFVGWEALFYLLNEVNFQRSRKGQGENSYGSMNSESLLLILFALGNFTFLIALLCGIGSS